VGPFPCISALIIKVHFACFESCFESLNELNTSYTAAKVKYKKFYRVYRADNIQLVDVRNYVEDFFSSQHVLLYAGSGQNKHNK